MPGSRAPRSRLVDRWLERWSAAFVMEIRSADGSTVLVGLDPSGFGASALTIDDAVARPAEPPTLPPNVVVPDSLRDLVP